MTWIHDLATWVVHWAATPYGTTALFCIAFAESSFFPIPPDVLLIALALLKPEWAMLYALVCSVGSVVGGMFGYYLGIKGGRPLLMRLFNAEKISLVEHYYHKYDIWAVGIAGFTPIPYKVFTISAGVFSLHFRRFMLVSAVSRSARFFLVGGVIALFGPTIEPILKRNFDVFSIAFIVLLIGGFYFLKMASKRMPKHGGRGAADDRLEKNPD